MDDDNFTAGTLSLAFIPQRENLNAIFASEKLENLNKPTKAVVNMAINDAVYELNTATASDAQVKFASNPDAITHTSNGINHQNVLSSQMIGIRPKEVSFLPPPMDPRIGANNQPAL